MCIGVVLMNSVCVILVKQKLMDAFGPIGANASLTFCHSAYSCMAVLAQHLISV